MEMAHKVTHLLLNGGFVLKMLITFFLNSVFAKWI